MTFHDVYFSPLDPSHFFSLFLFYGEEALLDVRLHIDGQSARHVQVHLVLTAFWAKEFFDSL
jgi:hypothetical protein